MPVIFERGAGKNAACVVDSSLEVACSVTFFPRFFVYLFIDWNRLKRAHELCEQKAKALLA